MSQNEKKRKYRIKTKKQNMKPRSKGNGMESTARKRRKEERSKHEKSI